MMPSVILAAGQGSNDVGDVRTSGGIRPRGGADHNGAMTTSTQDHGPSIALVQPAYQPPDHMVTAARAAEQSGLSEVWLWEDCFYSSGIAPAAAILAATQRMRVGIGLLPVPLRAPSLTAMEIAAIARMFPGRFLPGLGHGVADWMAQAGVQVDSPLTLLREHLEAIVPLLQGAEVTRTGRYVSLARVRLNFPPQVVPPVYVGGRGPRTLALGAEFADGVILDDAAPEGRTDPARVRQVTEHLAATREAAGRAGRAQIVVFLPTRMSATAGQVAEEIAALHAAGADRVGAFAGGVDALPASGDDVLRFVDVLAAAQDEVRRGR